MNLHKVLATNNYCYTDTGYMKEVKGIMVHSTGANNPNLRRYVGPDDGLLGPTSSMNWNQRYINGKLNQIGVHAFIGKLLDGTIATYQVQEWNKKCNHCGVGTSGKSGNSNYISFEICEDDLKDEKYFRAVYQEAVELCAYLCKEYNLDPLENIVCHCEGYAKGFASNHADVMHWFKLYNTNMDQFRSDVKACIEEEEEMNSYEAFEKNMNTWIEKQKELAPYDFDEAKEALSLATEKGIIKGDDTGRYMWKSFVSREQLMIILHRAGVY